MLRLGNRFRFVPSSRSMSPIIARRSYWVALLDALRAHEALGRPDALPGLLEVVHRLFEDHGFVGHDLSIRPGILRSVNCLAFSREHADSAIIEKAGAEDARSFAAWHYAYELWGPYRLWGGRR